MKFINLFFGILVLSPSLVLANPTYQSIYQLNDKSQASAGINFAFGADGRFYGVNNDVLNPAIWSVKTDGTDFSILDNPNKFSSGAMNEFAINSQGLFFNGALPTDQNDTAQGSCPYVYHVIPEGGTVGVPHYKYGFIYKFNAQTPPEKLAASEANLCPRAMAVDKQAWIYFISKPTDSADGIAEALYKMPSDGSAAPTLLHTFTSVNGDGLNPFASREKPRGIYLSNDGQSLYGLNGGGGDNGKGYVWRINLDGSGFEKIFHNSNDANTSFLLGSTASNAQMPPFIEVNGYLYGTGNFGESGPPANRGGIWRIKTDGTEFTKLFSFVPASSGRYPAGTMALGGDGNIYGTAFDGTSTAAGGTIYRINPTQITGANSGVEIVYVMQRDDSIDGIRLYGLINGRDGKLYGVNAAVSTTLGGRVYALDIGYTPSSPVINSFVSSPNEVEWIGSAQSVATLSWDVSNASVCTASGAWSGNKTTSGSEQVVPAQLGDNIYTLTCDSGSGLEDAISAQSVTVKTVEPISSSSSSSSVAVSSSSSLSNSSNNSSEPVSSSSAAVSSSSSVAVSSSSVAISSVASSATVIDSNQSSGGGGAMNLWWILSLCLLLLGRRATR